VLKVEFIFLEKKYEPFGTIFSGIKQNSCFSCFSSIKIFKKKKLFKINLYNNWLLQKFFKILQVKLFLEKVDVLKYTKTIW